jgi:hypothetical protein
LASRRAKEPFRLSLRPPRLCGQGFDAGPYFTTNVKKLLKVCVCPFNVVVKDKLYVPAGVAPFGPDGKLLQAADPNATSNNVANVNATRRFRRIVHAAPPSITQTSSNPIPPPTPPPIPPTAGANPVEVVAP